MTSGDNTYKVTIDIQLEKRQLIPSVNSNQVTTDIKFASIKSASFVQRSLIDVN